MSNCGFKGGVHDTVVSPENVTVEGGSICTVYERIIIAGYFRMVDIFVKICTNENYPLYTV